MQRCFDGTQGRRCGLDSLYCMSMWVDDHRKHRKSFRSRQKGEKRPRLYWMGENGDRSSLIMTFFRLLKHHQWNIIVFCTAFFSRFEHAVVRALVFFPRDFCSTSSLQLLRIWREEKLTNIVQAIHLNRSLSHCPRKSEILSELHRLD